MADYSIEDELYDRGLEKVFTKIRKDAPQHISDEEVRSDAVYHFNQMLATVSRTHGTWLVQNSSMQDMSSRVSTILRQGHRNGLLTLLTMGKGVSQSTAEEIADNHILIHT